MGAGVLFLEIGRFSRRRVACKCNALGLGKFFEALAFVSLKNFYGALHFDYYFENYLFGFIELVFCVKQCVLMYYF